MSSPQINLDNFNLLYESFCGRTNKRVPNLKFESSIEIQIDSWKYEYKNGPKKLLQIVTFGDSVTPCYSKKGRHLVIAVPTYLVLSVR